ncbi:hypothetical protein PFLUV_G00136610 [Perca fluviatilis]|uniref:Uncharacterized protein n=1 Tax=Perca fluviatilis TaxID=8168 RepID=A0A6A5EXY8_PERFL|nr:hypothetical protein PFLUV_G00136610 [Perca fluviatilis]
MRFIEIGTFHLKKGKNPHCGVEERFSALTCIGGWVWGSSARPRFTCDTWLVEIALSGRVGHILSLRTSRPPYEWQRWHSIVQNILSRGRSSCGSCLCAPHIAGEPKPTTVDISDRGGLLSSWAQREKIQLFAGKLIKLLSFPVLSCPVQSTSAPRSGKTRDLCAVKSRFCAVRGEQYAPERAAGIYSRKVEDILRTAALSSPVSHAATYRESPAPFRSQDSRFVGFALD